MFRLVVRSGAFRKKRPSFNSPQRIINLDLEPAPTISATGIHGCFCSQYWIEHDGAPQQMTDVPKVPRPGKPPQLFDVGEKPPYRVPSMEEIRRIKPNGLTVVSTFAGAGGSSTGYRLAGFNVLWANEFVPSAQESYRANCAPHTIVDGRSIKEVTAADILAATGLKVGDLDVLDGSPPCQAFSMAGKREKGWGTERTYEHGDSQKNEELFSEYIRIRDGLMPRVFVAENVSGLVKGVAKGFFLEILKELRRGYRVVAPLLDAQWLGVPQARQRIVFIGVRDDLGIEPPKVTPLPYRYSVRDALPWLGGAQTKAHGFTTEDAINLDKVAPTVPTSGGKGSYQGHEVHGARVVHDTRGIFKSAGTITDRPAPTIMSSPFDANHFQVIHETNGSFKSGGDVTDKPSPTIISKRNIFTVQRPLVEFDTKGTGTPNGPIQVADRPSPAITTTNDNQFHVVGTSNAPQKGKKHKGHVDDPAITIMARRSNIELQVEQRIMTGHGGSQGAREKKQPLDSEHPSPAVLAAGGKGGTKTQFYLETERRLVGVGGRGGFGNSVISPADGPAATIGTGPHAGNGLNPAGAVYEQVAGVTEKRKFTILEVKRLCSFPDDFELKGSYGQQWERLGNSVPPVMMQKVAEAIRDEVLLPSYKRFKWSSKAPSRSSGPASTKKVTTTAGLGRAASSTATGSPGSKARRPAPTSLP